VIQVERRRTAIRSRVGAALRHTTTRCVVGAPRNNALAALNLREPARRRSARELCATADVDREKLPPGAPWTLEHRPEQVHPSTRECIYARRVGVRQSGSYRDRAPASRRGGEAIAVSATSTATRGRPRRAPASRWADTLAAQSAFQGI